MWDIEKQKLVVENDFSGKRLDTYLSEKFLEISRSYFKRLITHKNVKVDSEVRDAGYKLKEGQIVDIEFVKTPDFNSIKPEKIDLNIIHEDEDIIIINKPHGMIVHPAFANFSGTLVNALMYRFKNLPFSKDTRDKMAFVRPGLVHRLDKETSGIMVIAKNENALSNLSKQFNDRKVIKTYLALTYGKVKTKEGLIETPIGRSMENRKKMTIRKGAKTKIAISHFKITEQFENSINLVEIQPKTGRTHQIRVHLKYIGLPIIGDSVYGVKMKHLKDVVVRTMLHAHTLQFTHPKTLKKITFKAELPEDFKNAIKACKDQSLL
ncbi:RluA family pseudouridine synthase [bacterium]